MSALLERAGHVRADYTHVPKLVRPGSMLVVDEAVLKWYEIAPVEAPVPPGIRELAYDAVCRGSRSGELELAGDLGFAILHRCGQSFYFLLVCTWRNDNELWETVWAKDGAESPAFEPWPVAGTHRPTFCVWELGAVCHEQRAWSRYLRSTRDAEARQEYLLETFSAEV
jgi:hypothetical protein